MWLLFEVFVPFLLLIAAPPTPTPILFFDLTRVLSATKDGAALKKRIHQMRTEAEAEVRTREQEVARVRRELERSAKAEHRVEYDRRVSELSTYVNEREDAMERLQEAELGPLQDRIEVLLAEVAGWGVAVAAHTDYPPLVVPEACDATEWLIAKEAKQTVTKPNIERCVFDAVLTVDLTKVMSTLPEKKRAAADLDSFQRERQAKLDTRQREVARMSGPEGEKAKLELADRYQSYQKDLADREIRESGTLKTAAIKHLKTRLGDLEKVAVVEAVKDVVVLPGSCEVTFYFTEKSDRNRLVGACPGLAKSSAR